MPRTIGIHVTITLGSLSFISRLKKFGFNAYELIANAKLVKIVEIIEKP